MTTDGEGGAATPGGTGEGNRRFWQTAGWRTAVGSLAFAVLSTLLVELTTGAVGELFEEPPPPGCPGEACAGRDADKTVCADGTTTLHPAEDNPVELQIRRSTECEAVWGRILAGEPGDRVILTVTGGATVEREILSEDNTYTMMAVVDEKDFEATVCAEPVSGPRRQSTWEPYCITGTEESAWR